jgi:ribose transport system substrate-binding protein
MKETPAARTAVETGSPRDPYLVKSIVHSSKVLSAFRTPGEILPLREVAVRSGLPKTMAFRLLYTLSSCGLIGKTGDNLYQSCIRPYTEKLYKLGYAGEGTDYPFSDEILQSLKTSASAEGIDLICLDNRCTAKVAQRNADLLVHEKVDLAIVFQIDESLAPCIAAKYRAAHIPMIAVEVPHPGATYYGANNHEAGRIAGRTLGVWAKKHWKGEVDETVLIDLRRAGSVPRMRLSSMLLGMKAALPHLENSPVLYLDGDGRFETSFEVMRRHLRITKSRRLLVGAINDASALGALRAFEEAGRAESCAIMGQNSSAGGRAELRKPDTRLIGSMAFFPENYGPDLMRVALEILKHRLTPPAVFVKHKLLTPETINRYYPYELSAPGSCQFRTADVVQLE